MSRVTAVLLAAIVTLAAWVSPARGEEGPKKDDVKVGYDKGFFIKTEGFSLTLGGRVQFRFTQPDLDGAPEDEDALGSFDVPRLRLTLGGHFYKPTVKYYIQYDLRGENTVTAVGLDDADASGDIQEDEIDVTRKREPDLRDAWLDFTKYGSAQLRVGQFKVPFSNQELTSSGAQQFVDRSIASVAFAPSRDQGAMVFGGSRNKKFGYMAGVFNGSGRNRSANDNEEFRYAVRVNFDPRGEYKLEESAVDHPENLNWTIGGAWTQSADDTAGEEDESSINFFFGLKYTPFSVLAEWYDLTHQQAGGPDEESDGYVLQAGLFVIPKKVEVAIRRSEIDPDGDLDDDEIEESRVAVNWFWLKHNFKLQLDYGIITLNENNPDLGDQIADGDRPGLAPGDKADDKELRAQLQFRF